MSELDPSLLRGYGNEPEEGLYSGLVQLGRKKTYVTLDDILYFFPEAERDVEKLEEAFSALLSAGIPYVDDDYSIESSEEEALLGKKEDDKSADRVDSTILDEKYFRNTDSDDTIGLYLKEAGRVPLLTQEEEVYLAKRIEIGRSSRETLAREGNSLLDEERHKYRRNIEDGWDAFEHLVTANSRLVISVAKKYQGRGVPFLDLIQEGNLGLIRAAKKFEYERGYKFSTYATWWIRQAVTRAIADQGRTMRVPVHMGDSINKLLRVQHQLTQRLGRDPTVEELAEALDVPPKKVENMIQVARRPLSLESPTNDEEDSVLGDFIQDEEAPEPYESAVHKLLKEQFEEIFNTMPPREVRILQLRYGLFDGQSYTLEEIGRKMGVTRERVRQIEAQALSRLRHPVIRRKLRDYLGE